MTISSTLNNLMGYAIIYSSVTIQDLVYVHKVSRMQAIGFIGNNKTIFLRRKVILRKFI